MRSSVSVMLSGGGGEPAAAKPDWAQRAHHHAALLLLVRGLGPQLRPFTRLWDRIQRVDNLRITDSSGHMREIWVRYVRDHPVENNDWGDFQTHSLIAKRTMNSPIGDRMGEVDIENIEVIVEDKRFCVKKKLLMDNCQYFNAMLNGNFKEHSQKEIEIQIVTASAFKFVLNFFETSLPGKFNLDTVHEIFDAVNYFNLDLLQKHMIDRLLSMIDKDTCFQIYKIGIEFHLTTLKNKILSYTLNMFDELKDHVKHIPDLESLFNYLSHENLYTNNEIDVFNTGCDWLKAHNQEDKILTVLSCVILKKIDLYHLKYILNHQLVQNDGLALQVLKAIYFLRRQNLVDKIHDRTFLTGILASASPDVANIVYNFFKAKDCRKPPVKPSIVKCVEKTNEHTIVSYNMTDKQVEEYSPFVSAGWWGVSIELWNKFYIVESCGMIKDRDIWNMDIKVFDCLRERWSILPIVIKTPRRHAITLVYGDVLYLMGGFGQDRNHLNSAHMYNLKTGEACDLPDLPNECIFAVAAVLGGKLYLSAGYLFVLDYGDNQESCWKMLIKLPIRYSDLMTHNHHLYFIERSYNVLCFWNELILPENAQPEATLLKRFNYNVIAICKIGNTVYAFSEGEQIQSVETCGLDHLCKKDSVIVLWQQEKRDEWGGFYTLPGAFLMPVFINEETYISTYGRRWRLLGLVTLGKYNSQVELNEICRVHESLKVKYSGTLYDSRAFFFGPGKPHREGSPIGEVPDIFEEEKAHSELSSLQQSEGSMSLPSDIHDSLSSNSSFPRSLSSELNQTLQEQIYTTPSNFKTRAIFYDESDPCADLEHHLAEFINSLFWILESKRLERSREKLEKVTLILAPFERKDIIGLDMESRNNKKRSMGRMTKHLADLTLQAGLVPECLSLYHSAAETLKSVNDWLWLGAAFEGLCSASAIILYPNIRISSPLHRNASLQEGSPSKVLHYSSTMSRSNVQMSPSKVAPVSSPISLHSDHTPSSSDSIDTSSKFSLTDNAESDSLASSSDVESHNQKHHISDNHHRQSQINHQYVLSGEDIAKKYRDAIIYYSNYKNAGIIETEAIFKAARISVEQNNSLQAANFLQNVILINLTLSEQEKIQRFDTLSEMYKEIGFLRKAAFCQRLAATRQVSPNNPSPDWQRCYYLMLHSFPGHKLSLDPNQVVQHKIGWPALQIQLLQELVVSSRRIGHPALATRHMTFLLQTMWPHLTTQERGDLARQLQGLSAQCEGGPVALVLETGEVIPPANLTHIPTCSKFLPKPPTPTRAPRPLATPRDPSGPFLYTPIHFGSLDRKQKKPTGKMDYLWVENDTCEVQLKLVNPLPFELKVSNMRLLTSGIVFESIPETVILQPETPTLVTLLGTPKESGPLDIVGYSTHTLGVKSNCRLKNMPELSKFYHTYSIGVIPSLPIIALESTLPPSNTFSSLPNYENVIASGMVTLYNGQSTESIISITNVSDVPIDFVDLNIQTTLDNQLQAKMFQWYDEEIQKNLPILPNGSISFLLRLHAEADFLDIGGSGGDALFPNSLTTNSVPSRVSSPTPNQTHSSLPHTNSSLPHTNSSFPRNASFRSSNSHSTAWSAPISVLPPTKGRQLDAQLVIRYSGGGGRETHCRQATLHINMELLPSVSITHWDVLPAEIPTQLYLVLDITNLTTYEMRLDYSEGRKMPLNGGESCRVPVPLKRCPLNMPIPAQTQDKDNEPYSLTINSANSIEQLCSEYISKQVYLRWHILQNNICGKATVKGITLSQGMLDMVRMSPLNWEVSINEQCIKPQEEYNCTAGDCISLGVAVLNHFSKPLKKLSLSVKFYQDHQNGVNNYHLDNRVATAGTNKVSLPILEESARLYHECSVIFLTPGQYKVDIQCSTSEPAEENNCSDRSLECAPNQCAIGEVNHIWRFIPPVAISVAD